MATAAAAGEGSFDRKLSMLLLEARPSASAVRAAAEAADAVAELIKKIPEQQATPEAARGFVRDLGLASEKLGFTFKPPAVVQVAGSLAAGTLARPDVTADLFVRLPKDICIPVANSKVWAKGLVIQTMKKHTVTKEDIVNLLKTFDVAICDVSGHVNLAFRMTKSAFLELQDEASCTLHYLDKCRDDEFEKLFMTKVDICAKFDSCLRINLKGSSKFTEISFCMDDESWRILEKDIQSLLQQGLTDRTKMIRVLWRSTPSEWNIMDVCCILYYSLEKSFRLVDIGPNPENRDEAAKFRKFWGEKAELRRFKDGTIAESTVWESKSWEKHTIIKRIADYVLMKHLSLENKDLIHVVDQLDFCLLVNGQAFRHTCVFPPEPHPLAYGKSSQRLPNFATTCIPSLQVMIQLEGSGNWPLDPVAMEKTKSAFLLKIGESLEDRGMFVSPSEDEVLKRMASYAKSSAELLTNLILNGQSGQYTWECAFPKTFKMWYGSVGRDAVGLTWENPKKRSREDADKTMPEPMSILEEVGDVGKGLVRGIYLLKAPKLQ
ncbi:hypothetical protein PR202_ga26968 [Eleusine coracana subsp. coracana]|uniref:Uncharacterized protein n=1 Tax=Eleusine coracana subsp. coracana TaxID=191504 RepID=A0AAV5DEP6_ELECO|nr:hypothetical protein PR202_ga26968 [Eleusine coracana subsp. coracana]